MYVRASKRDKSTPRHSVYDRFVAGCSTDFKTQCVRHVGPVIDSVVCNYCINELLELI